MARLSDIMNTKRDKETQNCISLNVARVLDRTQIYGPGWRTAIWVQGCSLACPGCWNEELWPKKGGEYIPIVDLIDRITSNDLVEGVTFLGGEPLQQAESLLVLIQAVKDAGKSVFLYTGYELDELDEIQSKCMDLADIAITGRYQQENRDLHLTWRGSSNQNVRFLSDRYSPEVMGEEVRELEVHIKKDGSMAVFGYPTAGDASMLPGFVFDENGRPI